MFDQLSAIADLWTDWEPTEAERAADRRRGRRDTSCESVHEADVVTEVGLALTMTDTTASRRVEAACALLVDRRLPCTAALSERGDLDWPRIGVLVTRTRDLTTADAAAVETVALSAKSLRLTIGRFERAVDRAVIGVDPDAAERRRRAARKDRRVGFFPGPDGTGSIWAAGPADAVTAARAALDAAARHLRDAGDPRTLDQLRFDLLVTGCTTGLLPVPDGVLPVPNGLRLAQTPGQAPNGAAAPPAAAGRGDDSDADEPVVPTWFTTGRPDVTAHIVVTVPLSTLLGLDDTAADLAGHGVITAQLARDLAAAGIWRCAAVDDTHGTVLGVGRSTWTPGYTPGSLLRRFQSIAVPECFVPNCTAPAARCDLDHHVPHARGGATCVCNAGPLCRRHHRLKSAGHLACRRSTDPRHPPGTLVWQTRSGRQYLALPHVPLPVVTPAAGPARETPTTTPTAAAPDDAPPF